VAIPTGVPIGWAALRTAHPKDGFIRNFGKAMKKFERRILKGDKNVH